MKRTWWSSCGLCCLLCGDTNLDMMGESESEESVAFETASEDLNGELNEIAFKGSCGERRAAIGL